MFAFTRVGQLGFRDIEMEAHDDGKSNGRTGETVRRVSSIEIE
jgi:hypothetical protein